MTTPSHIFISSGEVSGDIAAARLVAQVRRLAPDSRCTGIGGSAMRAAGVDLAARTPGLSTVGVVEVLRVVPLAVRTFLDLRRTLRVDRPDVAVLVGNDIFNTLLARWLKRLGVPTVSYFPPQPWIWRSLARPIARSYDTILACFPVDRDVYGGADGGSVTYVGHYLATELQPASPDERRALRTGLGLDAERQTVALLPGSRRDETRRLTSVVLDAATNLRCTDPLLQFVIPAIPDHAEWIAAAIARDGIRDIVVTSDSQAALRASDAAVVASGTASLEAALLGVPMVIMYRVAALTHWVIRAAIRTGLLQSYTFGLPNLILGRHVVPELGQHAAIGRRAAREVRRMLDDEGVRQTMTTAFTEIRTLLERPDGLHTAASTVLDMAGTVASRAGDIEVRSSATREPRRTRPQPQHAGPDSA